MRREFRARRVSWEAVPPFRTAAAAAVTVCLIVAYLAILNQTLRLDAAASQAIHIAAQNDLQWVLTHTEPPPREE